MKYIFYLLALSLSAQTLSAQNQIVKARIGENEYKQMTINIENGIAKISQSDIAQDASILPSIYNLAGLEINEGMFTIPDDGATYWFVYFDKLIAEAPAPWVTHSVICLCGKNFEGCQKVGFQFSGSEGIGCKNAGCDFCILQRVTRAAGSTGNFSTPETVSPFVILKANQVIFL